MATEKKEKEESDEKDTVAYTVSNGIAWVSFNRPEKRNCMNPKLNRRMMEVLDELEFRDDVGVLVLKGEGAAWSAGMDLKEYFRETEAQGMRGIRKAQSEAYGWWRRLRWYQKTTIAMVNGWCLAADTDRYSAVIWRSVPMKLSLDCRKLIGEFYPAGVRRKWPPH